MTYRHSLSVNLVLGVFCTAIRNMLYTEFNRQTHHLSIVALNGVGIKRMGYKG